LPGRWHMSLVL